MTLTQISKISTNTKAQKWLNNFLGLFFTGFSLFSLEILIFLVFRGFVFYNFENFVLYFSLGTIFFVLR